MRFIPLVLVTKSILPLSANAISADWIHQRRCCVRWFVRPCRQQTHQFRVGSCHGDQVQTHPLTSQYVRYVVQQLVGE